MKYKISFLIMIVVFSYAFMLTCSCNNNGEMRVIPLPGFLMLIEDDEGASIINIVDSGLNSIWWNHDYVIAESNNNKWYVIDCMNSTYDVYLNKDKYNDRIESLSINIELFGLEEARRRRENELGFKFSHKNIGDYITVHDSLLNIDLAIKKYKTTKDYLPQSIEELKEIYVLKSDPWGAQYKYEISYDNNISYKLWSDGPQLGRPISLPENIIEYGDNYKRMNIYK